MVVYVVNAKLAIVVSSLFHSHQFCIWYPLMEFCSCFEQMYYIGFVLCFSRSLGKEFLSDADGMPVCSLDGSSFGRLIVDYCGCKIIIRPLNGLFICVSKFLRCEPFPRPRILSLSNKSTCCAEFIFRHENEVDLSLSYVAVSDWLKSSVAYNWLAISRTLSI